MKVFSLLSLLCATMVLDVVSFSFTLTLSIDPTYWSPLCDSRFKRLSSPHPPQARASVRCRSHWLDPPNFEGIQPRGSYLSKRRQTCRRSDLRYQIYRPPQRYVYPTQLHPRSRGRWWEAQEMDGPWGQALRPLRYRLLPLWMDCRPPGKSSGRHRRSVQLLPGFFWASLIDWLLPGWSR